MFSARRSVELNSHRLRVSSITRRADPAGGPCLIAWTVGVRRAAQPAIRLCLVGCVDELAFDLALCSAADRALGWRGNSLFGRLLPFVCHSLLPARACTPCAVRDGRCMTA